MAWSTRFESRAAFEGDKPSYPVNLSTDEVRQQYLAARIAAEAIIASGAVVDEHQPFSVSFSGHANPEHRPTPYLANDTLTVTVIQKGS